MFNFGFIRQSFIKKLLNAWKDENDEVWKDENDEVWETDAKN